MISKRVFEIDSLIHAKTDEICQLCSLKSGLTADLLTGRVRVSRELDELQQGKKHKRK